MTVDSPDLILNSFGTHFPAEMLRRSSPMADRISAMPDSVLCHILSFLPTKLAVATSVLSKRWKPLWLSLLTLDFDDESFEGFLHFVCSILLSRDPTLPVHSLHLKLRNSSDCDQYDINRFVHFAAQRGLKNLTLHLYGIKLPPGVVEATTLVILNLKMLIVNDLPFVDFPSLKTLHLDCVIFESYECLQKLLSACPILEDLESKDLGVVGYESFLPRKEVKRLTNLVRANICDQHIPFTSLYNAEFLHVDMKNVHILYYDHPTFVNLIHLELSFEREDYDKKWDPESSYGRWEWRWEWVLEGLEHCPKLQNLNILDESYWIYEEWMEPQTIAECLSSQLRTFSLRSYNGTRSELKFVKYIMQNSKVLRNMTIQSSQDVETDEKPQMLMELSLCPMGSTTCKLLFN